MRSFFLFIVLACATAHADNSVLVAPQSVCVSAQQHAEVLAYRGTLFHSRCNRYEGIGTGATPDQARRNCCFFGKRQIVEEGIAYSPARRKWYAVIRYR